MLHRVPRQAIPKNETGLVWAADQTSDRVFRRPNRREAPVVVDSSDPALSIELSICDDRNWDSLRRLTWPRSSRLINQLAERSRPTNANICTVRELLINYIRVSNRNSQSLIKIKSGYYKLHLHDDQSNSVYICMRISDKYASRRSIKRVPRWEWTQLSRCNATANIPSLIHIVSLIRVCTNLELKGEIITLLDRDIRLPRDRGLFN